MAGLDFRNLILIFEGECVHGQRQGKGVLIYKYLEEAHKSIANQMGVMTQKKYIGEFMNNVAHGYGTMIYENGSKFVGFF